MWQESKQKRKFKDRKGSDRQSTEQSGSPANPPRILPVQGSRRARDGGRERQRYKCKRERERGSWEGGTFRRSDSSTSIPADSHVCFKRVSVCVCVCVCLWSDRRRREVGSGYLYTHPSGDNTYCEAKLGRNETSSSPPRTCGWNSQGLQGAIPTGTGSEKCQCFTTFVPCPVDFQ